jgi:hypothetical protein
VHREGRAAFSFCILDKWIYFQIFFLDYKIIYVVTAFRGDCCNYCGCLQFSTSEERRHTLQISVPIGVPRRRVPGPIVLVIVLNG